MKPGLIQFSFGAELHGREVFVDAEADEVPNGANDPQLATGFSWCVVGATYEDGDQEPVPPALITNEATETWQDRAEESAVMAAADAAEERWESRGGR